MENREMETLKQRILEQNKLVQAELGGVSKGYQSAVDQVIQFLDQTNIKTEDTGKTVKVGE